MDHCFLLPALSRVGCSLSSTAVLLVFLCQFVVYLYARLVHRVLMIRPAQVESLFACVVSLS